MLSTTSTLPQRALDHPGIVGRVTQFGIHVQLFIEEGLHALVIADLLVAFWPLRMPRLKTLSAAALCLPCHHLYPRPLRINELRQSYIFHYVARVSEINAIG